MARLLAIILTIGFLLAAVGPAQATTVIWVTDDSDGSNPPSPDDIGWADLLTAQGYTVDRRTGQPWRSLDAAEIADLNAADLVIVSRDTDSGQYDDGSEPTDWNAITTPLMQMSQYLVRSSRWKWLNTGGISGTGDGVLEVIDTGHPIFQGVTLGAGDTVDIATSSTPLGDATSAGNGQLLAIDPDNNGVAIAFWDTGTEFYSGAGQFAGGPRMFFGAGLDGNNPKAGYNLTADGELVFLNAVDFLAPQAVIPEPSTFVLAVLGLLGLGLFGWRKRASSVSGSRGA